MRALGTGYLSARDSMKGTVTEGSFTGDPERYVKQGSEMGVCFHRGPTFGEQGGTLLLTAFLFGEIFMRFSRDMQMPCKRVSLSIGALLGNLEGVYLSDF
jgi:hypothetical protein